ncbi:MAG: hypothetical protein HYT83_00255 [Candidatus Levybacteria bacterium]|nr:hypothetical protein [Candidatus Levybacteria bacterium]
MKKWIAWLILLISVFAQSSVTTIPLVLNVLLVYYIVKKESWVVGAAFFSGFLLDIITLGHLGKSSVFLIIFLFIVMLYEKKFEIQTVTFVFFSSFSSSIIFLFVYGYQNIFINAFVSSIISIFFFLMLIRIVPHRLEKNSDI